MLENGQHSRESADGQVQLVSTIVVNAVRS